MQNRPAQWNGARVPYGAGVEELERLVRGPVPDRWAAFVALAHTPGESALAVLRESARSSDAHVRRAAVEAIGVHPEGRRLSSVVSSLLSDTDGFVARSACEAAEHLRLTEVHDAIVRLLNAVEESTRRAAVATLREMWQETDFERVFLAFASDASDEVRKEAAWTLRSTVSRSTWRRLFSAWSADELPRHRRWACELAVAYGSGDVLGDIHRLLKDVDGHVRHCAALAVRELKTRGLTSTAPESRTNDGGCG
jgi:HEAT repeat protein